MNEFPQEESLLEYYVNSLGPYQPWLTVGFLGALALTIVLIIRGRGPSLPLALLGTVSVPLVIASIAFFHGLIKSYSIIGESSVEPAMADISHGFSMSIVTMMVAGMQSILLAFVVTLGGMLRVCLGDKNS